MMAEISLNFVLFFVTSSLLQFSIQQMCNLFAPENKLVPPSLCVPVLGNQILALLVDEYQTLI